MVNRVLLIRHGETDDNVIEANAPAMTRAAFAEYVANCDHAMLTVRGREQARQLGEKLAGAGLSRLYISPLARARETAAIVATIAPLPPPTVIDDLRELIPRTRARSSDAGNAAVGLRRQLWPSYARMLLEPSSPDRIDRSLMRMRNIWRTITADPAADTVGVIGHGWATIVLIRLLQLDWRWRVGYIDLSPCGVTVVERR
jgi:broad specificity phosphatase PhoE